VRWEGFRDETLSFQQDKAGPHRYIPANDWLEEYVEVEEWPSSSPDLSPIENVWAFIYLFIDLRISLRPRPAILRSYNYDLTHLGGLRANASSLYDQPGF